jgi:hypothetical protein
MVGGGEPPARCSDSFGGASRGVAGVCARAGRGRRRSAATVSICRGSARVKVKLLCSAKCVLIASRVLEFGQPFFLGYGTQTVSCTT